MSTKWPAKIGFVGLGDMGAKQARLIAGLPQPLTVFDARPEAVALFAGIATAAGDIRDLGGCDLIGLCVADDAQVCACMDQLLPVLRPGAIVLIHATIDPDIVVSLAARAEPLGVTVRDAPVTRTRPSESGPFVFCPMGGDEATKARVQFYLDVFATDTLLVGPIGAAMTLKICNNLVSWCEILVALEAVRLVEAAGVSADILLGLMGTNGLLTPPMRIFTQFMTDPVDDSGWRRRITGAAVQAEKDLRLANRLADRVAATAPMADFARTQVKETIGKLAGQF